MAIFHFDMSALSRGRGQSAAAAAAYRGCRRMTDERTGTVADFTRKEGHIDGGVFGWDGTPEALWNAAEAKEKHPRAQIAREIKLALPHELSEKAQFRLTLGFCLSLRDTYGVAGQFDLHAGSTDPRNVHAHILFTTRIVETGVFGAKTRELDCKPSSGEHLKELRANWEQRINAALAREGLTARVDRRSSRDRGLDVEPMEHLGPARAEAERRGRSTAAGDRNRRRKQERAAVKLLMERRQVLDDQITEIMRQRDRTPAIEAAIKPRQSIATPQPAMSDAVLDDFIDRMLAPTPLQTRIPIAQEFILQAQNSQNTEWTTQIGPRIKKSLRRRHRDSARRLVRLFQETVKHAATSAITDITKLISFLAEVLTRDERER